MTILPHQSSLSREERERIRREAECRRAAEVWRGDGQVGWLADAYLEALAALEQAERERDEYKRGDQLKADTPRAEGLLRDVSELSEDEQAVASHIGQLQARLERAERERGDFLRCWKESVADVVEAEARLAKVPALVEALREIGRHGGGPASGVRARDALAVWEAE